jgi:serine/threonine-protein kinase HipA
MPEAGVEVVVQIGDDDALAGRLWSHRRRGAESATFSYAEDYLARDDAYELDPGLPLVAGQQQTRAGQAMFGALSDCAPDRWGRRLIARAERQRATREGVAERGYGEIDYLLGVRDDLRQGALRLRDPATGTYLADDAGGVPPLVALPKLLSAAERLERDEASEDELRLLLRDGSSLGGARPKAHVLDAEGRVSIAKFPSGASDVSYGGASRSPSSSRTRTTTCATTGSFAPARLVGRCHRPSTSTPTPARGPSI